MKKLLLILAITARITASEACTPKNILVIGQSNAVYLNDVDLSAAWGSVECPAKIYKSVRGGTDIASFMPSWSTAALYGKTSKAIENDGVTLDAIIFWQGENDTKKADTARDWAGLATQTIQSYRAEYGTSKDIPVFIFQLNDKHTSPEPLYKYWNFIRNRQASMARKNVTVIDTSIYKFKPDLVHLIDGEYENVAADMAKLINQ